MKAYRELLAKVKKADTLFNLIEDGDRIVVGISGGKDSIVLFDALVAYKKYSKKSFTILPVILDLGFTAFDATTYSAYFQKIGYELIINDSKQVASILEINKAENNLPKLSCSICSRMKKAAINNVVKTLGANKVAFAHHIDDALETLWMNMIGGARIATFQPKMFLQRAEITFIRPLILADEALIMRVLKARELPLLTYACPNNKKTRREDIKGLLMQIYEIYPEAKANFELMLTNDTKFDLWYQNYETLVGQDLYIKKVITPAQQSDALFIRTKVFIAEQGISVDDEFDTDERLFTTFVLYHQQKPIGTIRYKYDDKTRTAHIGRIAVIKSERSQGYGSLLIKYVETLLRQKYGDLTALIGGQAYLKNYYEKLGYKRISDEYLDAGIVHFEFKKVL